MPKVSFCTIITANYLHYALALNESLLRYQEDIPLHILVSDKEGTFSEIEQKFPNIQFLYTKNLCNEGIGKAIYDKYAARDMDAFRWSMKGVLLNYLLEIKGYEKAIFLDCDIYFFNDYHFLWEELEVHPILLTPHWRCMTEPMMDQGAFGKLFTEGLYNAGFIGANRQGIPALQQLAKWCLYKCIKEEKKGFYVDQAYLNLLPIYFEGVKIIRHKGCNVAGWNVEECQRVKEKEEVLINGKYKIIFIHFVKVGIWFIFNGKDHLLKPHLAIYEKSLKKYKQDFDLEKIYKIETFRKLQRNYDFFNGLSFINLNSPFLKKLVSRLMLR